MLDELADEHGDAPALMSDAETLSYRALAARANRYARWALAQGLAKGETVGLLMPNRPDYMAAWLGITPGRRRGGAAQHQSHRPRRSRIASTSWRRGT